MTVEFCGHKIVFPSSSGKNLALIASSILKVVGLIFRGNHQKDRKYVILSGIEDGKYVILRGSLQSGSGQKNRIGLWFMEFMKTGGTC